MSPLKLELLLRAYSMPRPNRDLPHEQAHAPAMVEAINTFVARGIFRNIASPSVCRLGYTTGSRSFAMLLTPAGVDLALRILDFAEDAYRGAMEQ